MARPFAVLVVLEPVRLASGLRGFGSQLVRKPQVGPLMPPRQLQILQT
jgi:hypothetical protein